MSMSEGETRYVKYILKTIKSKDNKRSPKKITTSLNYFFADEEWKSFTTYKSNT